MLRIALSSDHSGVSELEKLAQVLSLQGYDCINYGPANLNPQDDYPDFIYPAAEAVASGECAMGIIMGGSGQGEAMVANRVKGIRCAVYYGPSHATEPIDADGKTSEDAYDIVRLSRQHNDANMLSFGVRFVESDEIEKVALLWLSTKFSGEARHKRRITKIDNPGH